MWHKEAYLEEKLFQTTLYKIFSLIFVLFILIFARLFFLQILKREYFKTVSNENRARIYRYRAPRGKIFARNKEVLVDNRASYSVVLSRFNKDSKILKQSLKRLSSFIDLDLDTLYKKLDDLKDKPFETFHISRDIPKETMFEISEKKLHLPGINIIVEPLRKYWLGFPSSHILGYISEINARELKKLRVQGYKRGDLIGKIGVEKIYDKYLRGEPGFKHIEVDAGGRQKKVLKEVLYKSGNDVYLNIDYDLQREAENTIKDKAGAIIALCPNTGKVLALVSSPGFDPIQFLDPMSEELKVVLNDPKYPLMNRAIQSQYAPGSVYKIITTIAGLEEGILDPDEKVKCSGKFYLGRRGKLFRCWKRDGHGKVNLLQGFYKSCDVYYYTAGLKIGVDNLARYSHMFGLNDYTDIDLPSEKKGLVPSPAWKRERLGKSWYKGDTVNMCIGQGYLLVTPIQLASMVSIVINGGYLYRPYLVDKIVSIDNKIILTNKPVFNKKISISQESIDFVKNSMVQVVARGTGRASYVRGLMVGGKTGTAENPHGDDHAWFVAFAPYDDPEIVLCVFVENGGHGGAVSAPIARRLLRKYFKI